jgi:hypothetical protein
VFAVVATVRGDNLLLITLNAVWVSSEGIVRSTSFDTGDTSDNKPCDTAIRRFDGSLAVVINVNGMIGNDEDNDPDDGNGDNNDGSGESIGGVVRLLIDDSGVLPATNDGPVGRYV